MRRRDVVTILGSAVVAWPLAARAQQKAMPVIGYLGTTSLGAQAPYVDALRRGLGDAGYVEGRNVTVEYRWAEGHYERLPALAADLVGRKVNVMVTSSTPGISAARNATSTIPIVFLGGSDLIAAGVVTSLARPGGNLTGISIMGAELPLKRFELLSELVRQAGVIALLVNPDNASTEPSVRDVQEAARAKGLQLHVVRAHAEIEIDAAFLTLVQLHTDALLARMDGP